MPVIHSPPDLERLAAHWPALEASARLPTQTRAWVTACAESFHGDGGLSVVATDDGRALAPLARRGARLGSLGVGELSEPSDWLATDANGWAALAEEVLGQGRPLRLERVPADSPTVAAVRTACRGKVVVRPIHGSPWIALEEGWRDPASKLSSRRRADLRRARRRAEAVGPVRAEVFAPGPDEVEALLDVAWDVESRSWRATREGSLAQDPLRGPFFRAWTRAAAADGSLRVALLHAGEQAVAMQLATVVADGYWLLKIGFDEAYKRCSPGMLLIEETVRLAAEAGLATYELMGVVEPWTHVWTERVRECVSVRTYPLSPAGASALAADGVAHLRARLRRTK